MAFHFKAKIRKVSRESTVNVSKLITGQSRIDLIDSVLRVVACNMEKGQYVRGYGSNRRTISFSHPNRAVLLYSKRFQSSQLGLRSISTSMKKSHSNQCLSASIRDKWQRHPWARFSLGSSVTRRRFN